MSAVTIPFAEQQRQFIATSRRGVPGISTLAFDHYEELLWAGTNSGRVVSFFNIATSTTSSSSGTTTANIGGRRLSRSSATGAITSDSQHPSFESEELLNDSKPQPLPRYTAFPAHAENDAVLQLLVSDAGVYSLSSSSLRLSQRRGPSIWAKHMPDSLCMSFGKSSASMFVSSTTNISLVDLHHASVTREFATDQPIVAMKNGRMLVTAASNGQVHLRDPNTLRIEHVINAHAGAIADLDQIGNMMITSGYSSRSGSLVLDSLIKLYDIRMVRPLAPIPFPSGPLRIKFHPKFTSHVFAFSQSGHAQSCDIMSPNYINVNFFNAQVAGMLSAIDISANGSALAIADAGGYLSLWSPSSQYSFNVNSRPSEYRDILPPTPLPIMDENSPLSCVGMPHYKTKLLSAWPDSIYMPVGRPHPRIPPEILRDVKMNDFVGYVQNPPTFKRNQNLVLSSLTRREEPKFRSQQLRDRSKKTGYATATGSSTPESRSGTPGPDASAIIGIPPYWRAVEIKYSKFGIEDFDFGFYNRTELYGGLESHIQNSYLNSLLQLLYFLEPMRSIAKSHIRCNCLSDSCLLCEMGFLFRMLEDSSGVNCQATNFLQTFGKNPQGLVDPEIAAQEASQLSYHILVQTACRFLLEQLNRELSLQNPHGQSVHASEAIKHVFTIPFETSTKCPNLHSNNREATPFTTSATPFASGQPQPNPMRRQFIELLQTSINKSSSTRAWCDECQKYQPMTQTRRLKGFPSVLTINANLVNEADHELWIRPDGEPFLPSSFVVKLLDGEYTVANLTSERSEESFSSTSLAIYDLQGIVSQVNITKEPPHLVTCVNVNLKGSEPNWYIFNDFQVHQLGKDEERRFAKWKVPAIVQYVRRIHPDAEMLAVSPTTPDPSILLKNQMINYRNNIVSRATRFTENEIPKEPGYICAIDTEFVALSHAEIEIRSDGSKSVIRPRKMGLARVSVVRGMELGLGVPFIDDYIFISEPIVDYLSEFSGIKAEDLDVITSTHPIVSLKTAYKKLRFLVDIGCVFVGHGLKSDCRAINIFIPPQQIIDTVDIFYLKQYGRKLSLRFLVWYFFREDFQLDAHDSIADAQAALRIYRKYLEAQQEGRAEQLLESIYEEGRAYQFRPPTMASAATLASRLSDQSRNRSTPALDY
eukprot:jgi/Hompol1/3932/HPOL_003377-RA